MSDGNKNNNTSHTETKFIVTHTLKSRHFGLHTKTKTLGDPTLKPKTL